MVTAAGVIVLIVVVIVAIKVVRLLFRIALWFVATGLVLYLLARNNLLPHSVVEHLPWIG